MITEEQKQILKFLKPSLCMTLIFLMSYHFRCIKRIHIKGVFPFKERHWGRMGSRKEREMQKELESCMTQGDPQLQVALGHPWRAQLPGDNVNAMPHLRGQDLKPPSLLHLNPVCTLYSLTQQYKILALASDMSYGTFFPYRINHKYNFSILILSTSDTGSC